MKISSILNYLFGKKSSTRSKAGETTEGSLGSMDDTIASNRKAWNEAADRHRPWTYDNIINKLEEQGHLFKPDLMKALNRVGVRGKKAVVLSCNNGRSVISLAKLGASEAVGFDLSEAFIQQGRELAEQASITCTLIASDIYEISKEHNDRYDLVLITPGSLICYPDLKKAIAVMARLLKPGGNLVMHEMHPILNMFGSNKKGKIMPPEGSYFRSEGTVINDGLDYYSHKKYKSTPHTYFSHRMDQIIQGCLDHGMPIISFEEIETDVSGVYRNNKKFHAIAPRSFLLITEKNVAANLGSNSG